jgi:hypothetical protein
MKLLPHRITNRTRRAGNPRKASTYEEPIAMVLLLLVIVIVGVSIWRSEPRLAPKNPAPLAQGGSACNAGPASTNPNPLRVSDSSGAAATLNIFIGGGGEPVTRQSSPLAIQGQLSPGTYLCTTSGDLVNPGGEALPSYQITSWARVDNDGAHVIVYVSAAPRYQSISGFGGYTGTVSLNDPRAVGASVPVDVHVEYFNVRNPLVWALAAAFGGLVWAWFIHRHMAPSANPQAFFSSLIFGVAVLTVAAIPVLNAQVLANPDWAGTLSQYITLGTLAGGAAIAASPTLRLVTSLPERLSQPGADAATGSDPDATDPSANPPAQARGPVV